MAEQQALDVARWFLALFFPGVALFYLLRLTVRRRKLGHSAVSHGEPGSRHWWLAKTFVVFRAAITVAMLGRAIWPGLDGYLFAGLAAGEVPFGPFGPLFVDLSSPWRVFPSGG